jgi:two-component system, NarL family, nitrate/nitrite response regulator NarL
MSHPAKTIRVAVVGSVRLYREGLADAFSRRPGFVAVGTRANLQDIIASFEELAPDVIVLLDTTAWSDRNLANAGGPDTRQVPIVFLEIGDSKAPGDLIQDTSLDELVQVVERAARGEMSRSKLARAAKYRAPALKASLKSSSSPGPLQPRLTPREDEIVNLLKRHLSNREIATLLGIEVATVKNHVHNVLEKLRVHRRSEAARLVNQSPSASGSGSRGLLERGTKARV